MWFQVNNLSFERFKKEKLRHARTTALVITLNFAGLTRSAWTQNWNTWTAASKFKKGTTIRMNLHIYVHATSTAKCSESTAQYENTTAILRQIHTPVNWWHYIYNKRVWCLYVVLRTYLYSIYASRCVIICGENVARLFVSRLGWCWARGDVHTYNNVGKLSFKLCNVQTTCFLRFNGRSGRKNKDSTKKRTCGRTDSRTDHFVLAFFFLQQCGD